MFPSETRTVTEPARLAETRHPAPTHRFPVTFRAVGLGLLGAIVVPALQVAWTVNPRTAMLPFPSFMTLFAGAIFWLFLLALVNAGLRRSSNYTTLTRRRRSRLCLERSISRRSR